MTVLCMFCCKALRKRQEPTLKKCRATLDYILCSPLHFSCSSRFLFALQQKVTEHRLIYSLMWALLFYPWKEEKMTRMPLYMHEILSHYSLFTIFFSYLFFFRHCAIFSFPSGPELSYAIISFDYMCVWTPFMLDDCVKRIAWLKDRYHLSTARLTNQEAMIWWKEGVFSRKYCSRSQ